MLTAIRPHRRRTLAGVGRCRADVVTAIAEEAREVPVPPLDDGACQVWWARPRQVPEPLLRTALSDTERQRADRYRREDDQLRSLSGAWLLRSALAAHLGASPDGVKLDRTCDECGEPHGRPRLVGDAGIELSVSHSGDRVAVAISRAGPVGVDVERIDMKPQAADLADPVSADVLSGAERVGLESIPRGGRHVAFIRIWVRKEALLKATGHGLRLPLDQVEVSGPAEPPALIRWPLGRSPDEVTLLDLDAGPAHAAALALLTGGPVAVSELDAGLLPA
jgi:4'-phosphopantetheinyl transferase